MPHTYQEVFSWKTGQELGSSLAVAGKEGEGATSREAGVWGASRRFFRAHPSHESRAPPGGWRGQTCREVWEASVAWPHSSPLWLCCCRSARFVLSLSPPLPSLSLFYLLSVSLILSLLPLSSLSLTPLILFPAIACLSLPLRVLLLLPCSPPSGFPAYKLLRCWIKIAVAAARPGLAPGKA